MLSTETQRLFARLYLEGLSLALGRVRAEPRCLVRWLLAHGQESAADTILRDWDDFVIFHDFPAEHWIHLSTSNPFESVFAGVQARALELLGVNPARM